MLADKFSLAGTIGFLAMPALTTRARGIARIDQPKRDTRQSSFVGHKGAELRECPAAHAGSLTLAEPCAVADAPQLLQGNPSPAVFGVRHKLLADAVIDIASKTGLPASYALQRSSDRLGAFALSSLGASGFPQPLTAKRIALPGALNRLAREVLIIADELLHPS